MFAKSYFAAAYFAPSYWAPSSDIITAPTVAYAYNIFSYRRMRRA